MRKEKRERDRGSKEKGKEEGREGKRERKGEERKERGERLFTKNPQYTALRCTYTSKCKQE